MGPDVLLCHVERPAGLEGAARDLAGVFARRLLDRSGFVDALLPGRAAVGANVVDLVWPQPVVGQREIS
jgi:hypothetical protein